MGGGGGGGGGGQKQSQFSDTMLLEFVVSTIKEPVIDCRQSGTSDQSYLKQIICLSRL